MTVGDIQRLERWGPTYTKRIATINHPEAMPHIGDEKPKLCARESGSKARRSTSLLNSRLSRGSSSNGSAHSSEGAPGRASADVEAALEKLEEGKTDEDD